MKIECFCRLFRGRLRASKLSMQARGKSKMKINRRRKRRNGVSRVTIPHSSQFSSVYHLESADEELRYQMCHKYKSISIHSKCGLRTSAPDLQRQSRTLCFSLLMRRIYENSRYEFDEKESKGDVAKFKISKTRLIIKRIERRRTSDRYSQ